MGNQLVCPILDIEKTEKYIYPPKDENYSPSVCYPEYMWGKRAVSKNENHIYKMIRDGFIALQLDEKNIGTSKWNPLSEFISENDLVLIKPNMVLSEHARLDCLITHPSVIRAVLDYVYLALKGSGRVIIGDAPMKRCVFENLITSAGYDALLSFYKRRGLSLEIMDFRGDNKNEFTSCNLKGDSFLCEKDQYYTRYRVTNFDYREMKKYHNPESHEYLIRKEALHADVIISLPKCKTHKKAGMTGACKNFVGTVVDKACLPHHIRGSRLMGGDEYRYPNLFKAYRTRCYEQLDICQIYHLTNQIPIWKKRLKWVQKLIDHLSLDPYSEGSWYGNDTIWRTFGDLNRILVYADKEGRLHREPQRKIFFVGDMVIAGEKEGPVNATPKDQGMILMGGNPVAFDCLQAKVMGFEYKKIPALKHMMRCSNYPLVNFEYADIMIRSKSLNIHSEKLKNLNFNDHFVAASGWVNHIEREQ